MLQAYVEGVGVDGAFLASRDTGGFEGLRLLAREFSLRSRAEASFFRTVFGKDVQGVFRCYPGE
jgi:hypothetical protein